MNGHGRVPTVFWALVKEGRGTAEHRRDLEPDECMVRLHAARLRENLDAWTPGQQGEFSSHEQPLPVVGFLLPLD